MQILHSTGLLKLNSIDGKEARGEDDDPSELTRVVSFVDAPGHETLMAVMISGASMWMGHYAGFSHEAILNRKPESIWLLLKLRHTEHSSRSKQD